MIFFISLITCILVHELGHFFAAKIVKCKIEKISIGFGKPFFKKTIKDTTYQITPFILGGYVKLKGELEYSKSKYAFSNLRYSHKVFITIAGCLINLILGTIALVIGLKLNIFSIYYFGFMSTILGITNLLPLPALDGSYIFLVWLEKFYGKKRGYELMKKIVKIGFIIILTINIIFLPQIIYLLYKGLL